MYEGGFTKPAMTATMVLPVFDRAGF